MTKDGSNARKKAAHELAEAEQIPYTEALRRIDQRDDDAPPAPSASSVRLLRPVATVTPHATLLGHTGPIGSLVFHPDGRRLASGGDRTVRVWDLADRQTISGLTLDTPVCSIALSPDGATLAVGGMDGTVALWTMATEQISTLTAGSELVEWLGFSPDGLVLAAGSRILINTEPRHPRRTELELRWWNLESGQSATWRAPGGQALAFHPDGHAVIGSDGTASLRLWNLDGEPLADLPGHTSLVETAAVSPDGRMLASGATDSTVRVWDLADGQTTVLINPHGGYVTSVAFSPDGRTLASGTRDGVTRLWDPVSGQHNATLLGHTDLVSAQAFSPDGRTLATGGLDMTIRLWTVA